MKKTSSFAANTSRGFTLVELLIVIAIIGILASVVIVSVSTARSKASATKVQAEVTQLRTRLEQSLVNNTYLDISGGAGNVAALVATSSGNADLMTLLCDIGKQNNYSNTVPNDLLVTCDGVANLHSGVVVITNSTDWSARDYAIYATTTPSGYVCVDSYGNTAATTSVTIPAYAEIVSTSTALCQ